MVATEADVRTQIAGGFSKATSADLEPFWDNIIPFAVRDAEVWIRDTLSGFGEQAIARWRSFESYHRRLSVFFAVVTQFAIMTDDQRVLLKTFDVRAEIMALESLGPDDPDSTSDDAVLGGLMERSDDLFRKPSVGVGGCLPGDIFNTPETFPFWR